MQWFPIAHCSTGRGLSKSGERRPQPALRLKLCRAALGTFLLGVSDSSCKPLELKCVLRGSEACSLRKVPEKHCPALRPQ